MTRRLGFRFQMSKQCDNNGAGYIFLAGVKAGANMDDHWSREWT